MGEADSSYMPAGIAELDAIFASKAREHAMAAELLGAAERFEEDMAAQRRIARSQTVAARHAGRRNPASKKARAAARRAGRVG